jgi:hypothetical protein
MLPFDVYPIILSYYHLLNTQDIQDDNGISSLELPFIKNEWISNTFFTSDSILPDCDWWRFVCKQDICL